MRFALVAGERQEAQAGLSGECPGCEGPLVPKCGEVRIPHWAHKGHRLCDPWWENETEWHRAWKDQFPADWQEIVHRAGDGERHIADVVTTDGWVIEFQHSHINPGERRSREGFYPKLLWVVNGARRKRDKAQLMRAWKEGRALHEAPLVRKVFSDDYALLREWTGSKAPIFFDFGNAEHLWWVYVRNANGWAYAAQLPRAQFIACHRRLASAVGPFDDFVTYVLQLIAVDESRGRIQRLQWDPLRPRRPRRHFRF